MTQETRRLYALGLALLAAGSVAACGDDNGGNQPPADLTAPTGLKLCQATRNSVAVQFNAVTSATSYVIERAQAQPSGFAAVQEVQGATTYTDPNLEGNVVYYYRVRAKDANGQSEPSDVLGFTAKAAEGVLAGDITCDRTLAADTAYTLRGYVKVRNGATLTIPAGTRLVGDNAVAGSSLWILRGAKINANGTAAAPIVLTSQKAVGSRAPGDWGGLVIVGNARINRIASVQTEGPPGVSEIFGGGTDDNDNSGTLRYVRVEFAGYDVSGGAGQELNSFSLYAVGRGTTLEYLQSLAGLDDAFEWFGGAVDGRYLVSYESGDDHFDASQGYLGRNQYLIALQTARLQPAPGRGDVASDPQGFEVDGCATAEGGCTNGEASAPFTEGLFANFTVVGGGPALTSSSGEVGAVIRRGAGGFYTNGIIARWRSAGLAVRDTSTINRFNVDSLEIANVLFAENGATYEPGSNRLDATAFTTSNHVISANPAASLFTDITPDAAAPNGGLDWTPAGEALTGAGTVAIGPAARLANFFGGTIANTTYFGAVDPAGPKWFDGWTAWASN